MIAFPFIFLFEVLICNLIFHPTPENPDASDISLILCLINILIVFGLLAKSLLNEKNPQIRSFVFISFVLRICILFWDFYMRGVFVLPNSEGDAAFYPVKAASYAFGSRRGIVDFNDFPYWVSLLYRMMGIQQLNVQFLHVYYAMCALLIINNILKILEVDEVLRKHAMALACFLPNTMAVMTYFLYESLLSFLVISSLYYYVLWWKQHKNILLIMAIFCSALAGKLHMGGIAIALGYISTFPIINNFNRIPHFDNKTLCSFALMSMLGINLLLIFGDTYLRKVGGSLDIENIQERSSYYEEGGSGYSVNVSSGGKISFIINTPIRFASFIFAPFPWAWRGVGDILAFFGSTIFFIYMWKLIMIVFKKRRQIEVLNYINNCHYGLIVVLVGILIIVGIMFGWGVSNAGSALRHREKYIYVYIVLYALIKNINTLEKGLI